jgi:hypothetical protein
MADRHLEFTAPPIDKRLAHVSYPVTPNNSLTSTPSGLESHHELPSFNNAETVRKIQEKKRKLEHFGSDCSENDMCYPFTPQNSSTDSTFENFAREYNLPSFCNAEMVEKVRVKRESLEILREDREAVVQEGRTDDFGFDPFTPSNSAVTDHKFDKFAKEVNLPSLRNSETVKQIREKRVKLQQNILQNAGFPSEEGEGLLIDISTDAEPFINIDDAREDFNKSGTFYDFEKSADFMPFTPNNSVAAQMFDQFAHEHDLSSFNSVAMVEMIRKKKNSLEKEPRASNSLKLLKSVPFTPQNSYTNLGTLAPLGQTDKYVSEGFMFDPDELVSRVAKKRKMSECLDLDAIDNGNSSSSTDEEIMFAFQGGAPGEPSLDEIQNDSDTSASSGSASLSAYENFMHGVSSSDEGLNKYAGGSTGASNLNEVEIAHNFVEGILKSAIEIVRSDESRAVIDNVVGQSQGSIHDDNFGPSSCSPEDCEIDQSQGSEDIDESEPLLDATADMDQSESPRHDFGSNSKKAGQSFKSTRVRFSVDDEELSQDAYYEMIADEIAGDDDAVVPIGGILQISSMDASEQNTMFSHNWGEETSDDSSDSDGHVGSYDINALNQDVVKNVAQIFVDDVIKGAINKYQNEAQEEALKKVADEFVAGVLKSATDEYIQSCKEAAEEFCEELIKQVLDDFMVPDGKNDASDDTGIFDTNDGFISPAGERLGKLNSLDSETSSGYRKGTPKSLSLDSPLQFMKHDHFEDNHVKKLKKNLSEPTPGFGRRMSDLDLETEYLCSYDPLFGNMEIVSSPDHSFATDAVRDVAENASFKRMRKESGIFDDSDGEDMDSLKKFLELRAMQEHFAERNTSPSGEENVNCDVTPSGGTKNYSASPSGSFRNYNYKVPTGGNVINNGNQKNNKVNCTFRRPDFRRHSDMGPAGCSDRSRSIDSRRDCAQDSGIDPGTDYVKDAAAGGLGSSTWGRGNRAWDVGSHGVIETCDSEGIGTFDTSESRDRGLFCDGGKSELHGVGVNTVKFDEQGLKSSSHGTSGGDAKFEKNDQTWISSSHDVTATETDALLEQNDHRPGDSDLKFERHFGVNSTVSDADAFEDLSEREDSEVFLDDSAAALLGSAAGSRRSSAKYSASSARTWSSHGSSKSDFGSTSDCGTTYGDYVRDLFIHIRRYNGDIVVLRKTFVQDKMSKLGIKMEKASQKEIFYTTAGRISIQVDSFPEFLEDGTRVIDEDGFVQLFGGRYEISQDLLDSADRLCKKIDEIKEVGLNFIFFLGIPWWFTRCAWGTPYSNPLKTEGILRKFQKVI